MVDACAAYGYSGGWDDAMCVGTAGQTCEQSGFEHVPEIDHICGYEMQACCK